MSAFDIPIVLCLYNRPDFTRQVLASLHHLEPARIFVVADGPKQDNAVDHQKCDEVIGLVEQIDWTSNIEWNIADSNLGCRKRIQSGLSWVFDHVEEAIILEDDCVPHPSFFPFCAELLDRYRLDPRVALIGGTNVQFNADCGTASYFFSRYPLQWGWAAWRRTWDMYSPDADAWDQLRDTRWLFDILQDPLAVAYWRTIFDQARAGFDTWDFSMTFSCWHAGALVIQPSRNLVTNIGFGPDATHTRDVGSVCANMPVYEMKFPLAHPDRVERSVACDERTERTAFSRTARIRLQSMKDALRDRKEPSRWTLDASDRS